MNARLRKRTVITPCELHTPLRRRVSTLRAFKAAAVEGGWGTGPCACHCKPGTDTYTAELVARYPDGFTFGTQLDTTGQ